jgi:7,8-dihydroneopterin 2',3'-cyclic phosphate phosphodiesterase
MIEELERLTGIIRDEELRQKVLELLRNPCINLEGEMLPFDECPGGAYVHHAYKGGLIQHTVAVTRLCVTLCDMVEDLYRGEVNRDHVMAGALLHDVMKCYAYTRNGYGGFRTSRLGERMDHLSLLVAEMYKRGFPTDVIHIVAAHHGEKSPVRPKSLEALIVSVADFADSELSRQILRAAEWLIRETTGVRRQCGSSEEALEIIRVKAEEGWEGVNRLNSGKDK